ncbi:DUF2254 domain-containing protein [Aquihabitans sp. McL0605]|uniref:DUF2254 domain-containing protein n=1 Tax=Aquihabitans sp. McL0605 TaxID=3415671 RepID=UPI003CE8F629
MFRLFSSAKTGLWFLPVACVLAGVATSFATLSIDRWSDYELVPERFVGGPDAALTILSTVALSMVSLAALVLTITMVVVQLAMAQFSPRIVQTILRDRPSQLAIGIFVATFAHAILAMRAVNFTGSGQVPGLSVVVAFVLVLISIATLVVYVHHLGQALRVASLIELVSDDTRRVFDELYPGELDEAVVDDADTITAPSSGVVSRVDHESLVKVAHQADCLLELIPAIGTYVPVGAPMLRVHGDAAELDRSAVINDVLLTKERELDQDPAYGLRMLVDIAERSLSDSPFLDPTTAVQALDRVHDCLRQLAGREFPDGNHADAEGTIRLVVPTMTWDAYVHLAFDEIRMAGAGSPQVARRLRAALDDLLAVAPESRQPVLRLQLERLESLSGAEVEVDVDLAAGSDALGLGAVRL